MDESELELLENANGRGEVGIYDALFIECRRARAAEEELRAANMVNREQVAELKAELEENVDAYADAKAELEQVRADWRAAVRSEFDLAQDVLAAEKQVAELRAALLDRSRHLHQAYHANVGRNFEDCPTATCAEWRAALSPASEREAGK
jgi:hypothetical protein